MTKPRVGKNGREAHATRVKLQAQLSKCPICGESIKGHFFGQVASTPISEEQKSVLTQFFGLVRQHEWRRLTEFNGWDGGTDNLVAYIIKGNHPNGVLIVLKDVFELYEHDEVVLEETLSPTEVAAISDAAAVEWHAIPI